MKKYSILLFLIFGAVFLASLFWLSSKYIVPVINYHSVDLVSDEPLNNVTPGSFARQMAFLKKHGYRVISASDLVDGLRSGRAFARNTVVITFDDGYDDNFTNAFPVLREQGFPATIFLAPDRVGTDGRLSWNQIRMMLPFGIDIGSHVMGEAYVPSLKEPELMAALADSKALIEENTGVSAELLAYPVGGYTPRSQAIARQVGYKAAFTTNRAPNADSDLFALRRIRLKDGDGPLELMIKLSGYYDFFRSPKAPY